MSGATTKWIGAGGEGEGTIEESSNVLLKIASSRRGSPFNAALFSDEDPSSLTSSSYYLQVKILALEGNLSVGVVTRDEFQPGYKISGMFYNGNLTNGSAALVTSFGDEHIKAGMTVGLLYEKDASQENVYIYVNEDQCKTCL